MNLKDTCIFCEHFVASPGTPAYSDYTPATDPWIFCMKDHWEIELYEDSTEDYRTKLNTAKTCSDWEPCNLVSIKQG